MRLPQLLLAVAFAVLSFNAAAQKLADPVFAPLR